ncbi:MAG: twin-arginine translocase TatA/TatE family subunit [Anaerolineales bacterium]|jgi:sec-independent protein translocase protein TatA
MPSNFGAPELIIILVVVLLVFGVGRLSRIGGEMGSAIREFRQGLQGDEPAKKPDEKAAEGESDNKA